MADKPKKVVAEGAFRVGTLTDWTKSDNERAPRRAKLNGKEWIRIWPEKTVGWRDRKPLKAPNEALPALGPIGGGETAGTVKAFIPGYEEWDPERPDFIDFYAEGVPTIPAPDDAIERRILNADELKGKQSAASPAALGDVRALVNAINVNTIINAQAAGVKLNEVDLDGPMDYLTKMTTPDAPAPAPAAETPEVAPAVADAPW